MPGSRPHVHRTTSAHRPLGLLLLGALLAFGACRTGTTEPGVQAPPIRLRSVLPDSTLLLDPAFPLDFTYTFNRVVGVDEYRLVIFPEPADRGVLGPIGTGRSHRLTGLRVAAGTQVLRALMLSPNLSAPIALHWFMTPDYPRSGIAGRLVLDPGGESTDPRGTVVFAFPMFTDFNPLDPNSMETALKSSVDVIEKPFADGSGGQFLLSFIVGKPPFVPDAEAPDRAKYIVAAIKDTSGDLRFDADEDWWTYLHVPGETEPTIVVAPDAAVELVLHPPGWRP